jgi:hypothetical protein
MIRILGICIFVGGAFVLPHPVSAQSWAVGDLSAAMSLGDRRA